MPQIAGSVTQPQTLSPSSVDQVMTETLQLLRTTFTGVP